MTLRDLFNMWLADKLPPCDVMAERISDQLDRKPTFKERIIMRLHLFTCVWCTNYRDQLKTIRRAVRDSAGDVDQPEVTPTPQLSEEAKERIRRSLDDAGRSSSS